MFVFIYFAICIKTDPRYSSLEQDKCLEPVDDDEYNITDLEIIPIVKDGTMKENDYGLDYSEIENPLKSKLIRQKI